MSDNTAQNPQSIQLSRATLIVVIAAVLFGILGITLAIVALTAPQVGIALFATETPTPTATFTPTPTLRPTATAVPPTATPSPGEVYAEAMAQPLSAIPSFREAVSDLDAAFDATVMVVEKNDDAAVLAIMDPNGDGKMSVREFLGSYDYLASFGMANPATLQLLDRPLSGPADIVDQRGLAILSQMEAVEPPADVATYHRQVMRCLDSQLSRVEVIHSAVKGRSITTAWDTGACDRLSTSVREIEEYIDAVSSAE